jgi:hypothetical protein
LSIAVREPWGARLVRQSLVLPWSVGFELLNSKVKWSELCSKCFRLASLYRADITIRDLPWAGTPLERPFSFECIFLEFQGSFGVIHA